ncbi:MAG: DNA methyltransferase [Candidatus Caldarchaeum sp.]
MKTTFAETRTQQRSLHFPADLNELKSAGSAYDFAILLTGGDSLENWKEILHVVIDKLVDGALLWVQGMPKNLAEIGAYLDRFVHFRYWIAIESSLIEGTGLPSVHGSVLLFTKGRSLSIRELRIPHQICKACGKPLRDWGGKSHLRHPAGTRISDVWKDLPKSNNYSGLSLEAFERILAIIPDDKQVGLVYPKERLNPKDEGVVYRRLPSVPPSSSQALLSIESQVILGDALTELRKLPDESIDLAFADPPYNLDKPYGTYDDEKDIQEYLRWCEAWLLEYVRVLRPSGSLFILNLPRWAMHHAAFLSTYLYFQNWIVWDALSEPRGKLMPAHYALLFYTKSPDSFTFHHEELKYIDARHYCLRNSCIRKRKALGEDEKEILTDLWWDVHRIKHRPQRDAHPCQLPKALLERIIRLTTNPGDIVLDAMAGTGTTAIVASQLGRRYIAIDIDPTYVNLMKAKLEEIRVWGAEIPKFYARRRLPFSKKALQLELKRITEILGRLPTPEDVAELSTINIEVFHQAFPTWGKALKAAKIALKTKT